MISVHSHTLPPVRQTNASAAAWKIDLVQNCDLWVNEISDALRGLAPCASFERLPERCAA
jgi:hypothetical protein